MYLSHTSSCNSSRVLVFSSRLFFGTPAPRLCHVVTSRPLRCLHVFSRVFVVPNFSNGCRSSSQCWKHSAVFTCLLSMFAGNTQHRSSPYSVFACGKHSATAFSSQCLPRKHSAPVFALTQCLPAQKTLNNNLLLSVCRENTQHRNALRLFSVFVRKTLTPSGSRPFSQ